MLLKFKTIFLGFKTLFRGSIEFFIFLLVLFTSTIITFGYFMVTENKITSFLMFGVGFLVSLFLLGKISEEKEKS